MGFTDFWKSVFSGKDVEAELNAARVRHGITVDEGEDDKELYDPWEEVRNARLNFFLGSWAGRKFRVIGEDKVKKQLEELEKKREEKEKRERGE